MKSKNCTKENLSWAVTKNPSKALAVPASKKGNIKKQSWQPDQ